ncbi:G1/S-specific cyclin-D2-like [Pectinophora gossypiella]|uniref:G1/S-specific cyclin-D2-like n=1 Tax=Pectinophora gossypiella TaxID=13191 RepID=UPI00214E5F1A|nr:G1/S-specific cyclin-D2-like [Pectinophora gossypiella]XP_049865448.1 G1/S-specific cyclin-D2-like [Pectinophora gossypiella]XP_049865450.1 G1/S-specific cyclin-D2-like [Pectinophora gossypiella]
MDLSCGENLQNSGNSSNGRSVDMCVAGPDRALDRDPRLLHNLLTLERAHALHTDYFEHVQIDIQPFMRKIVTTWMLEVCEEQQCEEQVFPLAVSYMDRFLAQRAISRQQLQLLGVTAMLLASKFRQCHPLSVDLLCAYTDNSVLPDEVRQWEVMLLQRLNWQLSIATAFDFVEPFLARVPWGRTNPLVRTHALTLISVCYTETEFLLVPPSLIAVACITAAARGLRVRMSVGELCALTRAPAAAAELVARHVERVLARATQPPEPRARPAPPAKAPATDTTQLQVTPTDVQDIHF